MKILMCHNYYQQPGGEDQVFADEGNLLESRGHEVVRHTVHNDAIDEMNSIGVAVKAFWNRASYQQVHALIKRERPDVVHFTNTFPLISPAAYYAASRQDVPIVQSLHNYRLLCPGGTFYRDQKPCEDCLSKVVPWPAIQHKCYRSDRLATTTVAAMTTIHRMLGTWRRKVDRYIALSHFSAAKFVAGGLPADKIIVKRNFVSPDPGAGQRRGNYAMFVGRLAPEKGIETLLDAWDRMASPVTLKIAGDGPLASLVRDRAARNPRIEWLGRLSGEEVLRTLGDAICLVMPSEWYECCPKTLIESLAVGTPAIVSRMGVMAEMIGDEQTGLHFEPRSADDLARQVTRLVSDTALQRRLRIAARSKYEAQYTAETNYRQLVEIYQQARAIRGHATSHDAFYSDSKFDCPTVSSPATRVSP